MARYWFLSKKKPTGLCLEDRSADHYAVSVFILTDYLFILFRDNNLYLSSSQCSFDFDSYYGRFMKLDTGGEHVSTDAARIKEFFFESREEHRQFLSVASFDYTI